MTHALKENINQMRKIIRELYIFTNQLYNIQSLETRTAAVIDKKEKKLLNEVIRSLTKQLIILNKSIPELVEDTSFYKKLETGKELTGGKKRNLARVEYVHDETKEKISLTISDKDRKTFLENLSQSHLSIGKLKRKYAVNKRVPEFGKPNFYAKLSNHYFRNRSSKYVAKGYFNSLNSSLREMNSPFVMSTYASMIFFTVFLSIIVALIIYVILLFFNVGVMLPFLTPAGGGILQRAGKYIWVLFVIPISTALLMYFYPSSEAKSLGAKIDQELPFVVIHMSAIATSGVEPVSIFKIILRSEEYKYANIEFRKLMNLINFHGKDFVTALKDTARSCPSVKLKALLDGLATAITSGGSLHQYLDKHAETLLFDYKLDREKYTRVSETFMDIYISIAIAAPMIFLMLFVIMGSTGSLSNFLGLSIEIISLLIVLGIVFLNVGFLVFLSLKQPVL